MMKVGIPKESFPGECRVALTPAVVPSLVEAGLQIWVEEAAGAEAGYTDSEYLNQGARVSNSRIEVFEADCILQVRTCGANPEVGRDELEMLHTNQIVVGLSEPLRAGRIIPEMASRGISLFALELIPRTTRAQAMDVLSSMASLAGYKAVLLAAGALPKMFPLMMTAAGTLSAARVLVIGAGVAGLQAIATARRLGAVVSAYDVRPAAQEQVESLGARFVETSIAVEEAEDSGGYARAQQEAVYEQQQVALSHVVSESDVVITTAVIPGKKAPVLISEKMVADMGFGSVVVDLAAENGGNCELTRLGETVFADGVQVMGPLNLPASIPFHSSQMYARNVTNFLQHLISSGISEFDLEDEIIRETLVTHKGEVVHPKVKRIMH